MIQSLLLKKINITHPIIQAGMAGGITTPELVAAVANAGGLGTIGAGYMTPEALREAIQRTKKLTDRPFSVNLFVPNDVAVTQEEMQKAAERLQPFYTELDLEMDEFPTDFSDSFTEQVDVLIEENIPVISFTFGIPSAEIIAQLKNQHTYLIGTATTVNEAIAQEKAGMDAVVAQGSEAGGHRGTFASEFSQAMIGTMALIPQVVDHVSIPVIAAGGIMDTRGIAAAHALGAQAAQLGTAFLTCEESGTKRAHQEAIMVSNEESTVVTKTFSGKPARGISNRFIKEMQKHKQTVAPYPIQNSLTNKLRREAGKQDKHDFLSLWAGQGTRLSKKRTVTELMNGLHFSN